MSHNKKKTSLLLYYELTKVFFSNKCVFDLISLYFRSKAIFTFCPTFSLLECLPNLLFYLLSDWEGRTMQCKQDRGNHRIYHAFEYIHTYTYNIWVKHFHAISAIKALASRTPQNLQCVILPRVDSGSAPPNFPFISGPLSFIRLALTVNNAQLLPSSENCLQPREPHHSRVSCTPTPSGADRVQGRTNSVPFAITLKPTESTLLLIFSLLP